MRQPFHNMFALVAILALQRGGLTVVPEFRLMPFLEQLVDQPHLELPQSLQRHLGITVDIIREQRVPPIQPKVVPQAEPPQSLVSSADVLTPSSSQHSLVDNSKHVRFATVRTSSSTSAYPTEARMKGKKAKR